MQIPKKTSTTESVAFKTPTDAIRVLQNPKTLNVDVREIVNTNDHQNLIRHVTRLKPPFGICVVHPKEI